MFAVARNVRWHKTPSKLRQIAKKSNKPRTETILHVVLKFQLDDACVHGEQANANFGGEVE